MGDLSERQKAYLYSSANLGRIKAHAFPKGKLSTPKPFIKGQTAWNKGKHWSLETREKIGDSRRGKRYPGSQPHTTEHKMKIKQEANSPEHKERTRLMGLANSERFKNPEYKERVIRSILKSICAKPNKSEQKLIDLFREWGMPYLFVGDGSVILGGMSPDFIHTNGKKNIIELFGEAWHDFSEVEERTAGFARLGFKLLVIWRRELKDILTLKAKVEQFELLSY